MAITGVDAYGAFTDTGVGTAVTARVNTEVELHVPGEVDTNSKNTVAVTVASHIPHRGPNSPR